MNPFAKKWDSREETYEYACDECGASVRLNPGSKVPVCARCGGCVWNKVPSRKKTQIETVSSM